MTQINQNVTATLNGTEGVQQTEAKQQTVSYEEIVSNLVTQGLPQAFNPNTYLSKIATNYNISEADARNCLKQAIKELEQAKSEKSAKSTATQDAYYAQSGYFYPSAAPKAAQSEVLSGEVGYFYPRADKIAVSNKQDGMDSLNSFGCYNRLMFGI